MKGASMMVKMSLVVVGVTLAVVHMKIDGFCSPQSRTETNTGGGNSGLIGKMFSGNSLKSTSIAAIATLALAFLASNSQASAAVSKAAHLNNDVVNEAAIKLETDNYLQRQFRSRRDIEHFIGDVNVNENIIGDYIPANIEDMEDWQQEDSYDDDVDNDDDSDYEYDDDEEYERFKRGTKLGNFEKKQMRCKKYEKQIVKRFAEEILERVESRNSTLILQDGQSKKLGKKLKLIKKKCDQEPITYVGPVNGGGEKTGEHEYTLLEMEKLGKMAEKYRKTTTLAPSTNMNDNDNILENNSTSILNGTNTDNISPIINKATISVTNSPSEVTENPECKIKERELLYRFSGNIVPEAAYNKSLFDFSQNQHEILARMLREMQQMNCNRNPLKYKYPVYAPDDVKFHHKYTLGDNISLNSIKEQLGLEISPTTVIPTENPGCEEKKIEMTRIVGSELREALENDEDTFEVRSSFIKKKMETVNEEMEEMNCISPFQFEPVEGSKKLFSMIITDNAYVQQWEDERRAKKKAEKKNEINTSDATLPGTSEEINEDISSENNEFMDLNRREHPKCDNRRQRLLIAVEREVDKALLKKRDTVKVAASKEKLIKRLLNILEEGHCTSPLEIIEEESGVEQSPIRFKILDIAYLKKFSDFYNCAENSELDISSSNTELTPPVSSTVQYSSSTDNRITHEPCEEAAIPIVREFADEIKDAINSGTNKFIVSLEKHQFIPNLNEYARNDCEEPLINFDDAHSSEEADKFAYYTFTDEAKIRVILGMPPITTIMPTTTKPKTTPTPAPTRRWYTIFELPKLRTHPPLSEQDETCRRQTYYIVQNFADDITDAIEKGRNYIVVHPSNERRMAYMVRNMEDSCYQAPFQNPQIRRILHRNYRTYDFSPNIQQKYRSIFFDYVYRAPDMILELPPLSLTAEFNQTGTENSTKSASNETMVTKVSLNDDPNSQSATTQSNQQRSTPRRSFNQSTINPICEDMVDDTIRKLSTAFAKMFAKNDNKLKLGIKQGNKVLNAESALIYYGCDSPFRMTDASYKGNQLRVTFEVEDNELFKKSKSKLT